MKIPDPYWFDFDSLCQMSDEIDNRHERVSYNYEYGLSWYEFLQKDEKVYGMAKVFLEEMDEDELKKIILDRIVELESKIHKLKECLS